jgi:hypothetical protein
MKKNIYLIILLIFLSSCGYTPIFTNKKPDFTITSIEIENKNQISYKIKNSLKKYTNTNGKQRSYEIVIKTDKQIEVTSKDEKGDPKTFNLTVSIEILIKENNKKFNKKFNKNFSYKNNYNAFSLKNYENSISNNLTDNIIVEMNDYLLTLPE